MIKNKLNSNPFRDQSIFPWSQQSWCCPCLVIGPGGSEVTHRLANRAYEDRGVGCGPRLDSIKVTGIQKLWEMSSLTRENKEMKADGLVWMYSHLPQLICRHSGPGAHLHTMTKPQPIFASPEWDSCSSQDWVGTVQTSSTSHSYPKTEWQLAHISPDMLLLWYHSLFLCLKNKTHIQILNQVEENKCQVSFQELRKVSVGDFGRRGSGFYIHLDTTCLVLCFFFSRS